MTIHFAHLLLVDSDQVRLHQLKTQLVFLGYKIYDAPSLDAMFSLIMSPGPDLLLIHVNLAAQHDFQLFRILPQYPHLRDIPVLLLGSIAEVQSLGDGLKNGAADYIIRTSPSILLDTRIKSALEHKRFREQAAWYLRAFNEMEKLADDLRLKILPLGIALSVEKNFDRLLELIVEEAMNICNADGGTLYLRTDFDELQFVIVRTRSLHLAYGGSTGLAVPFPALPLYDENGQPMQQNISTRVVLEGHTISIPDVYQEPNLDFSGILAFDREHGYHTVSTLVVPLHNHTVIGVLQLINAQDELGRFVPFDAYHQLVAESLASQATVVLHNHILTKRHEELLGFQRELEIARQLQAAFLPQSLPQPAGWCLVAKLRPARVVAGDFYDAFTLSDGRICLVVADVCDKGVAAALFMALVRSLIRAFVTQFDFWQTASVQNATAVSSLHFPHPDNVLMLQNVVAIINAHIYQNHQQTNMFTTCFIATLNPQTGWLTYVNAGHNPPAIFHAGQLKEWLEPTGPAVGLWPQGTFAERQVQLQPGDLLFAYTDGVTEARNIHRQQFSRNRLLSLVADLAEILPGELLTQVETAVQSHVDGVGQYDDITLLALQRRQD